MEQDVEITDTIKDRMDTVRTMRFVGPIVWILANVLIFMPRFDIQILNGMHDFLTWPYIGRWEYNHWYHCGFCPL